MILIVGATGVLGGRIAGRLLEQRRPIRVLTREATRASSLVARGAGVAVADLTRPGTLEPAMRGVTEVITTANAFVQPDRRAIASVDEQGNQNLIDAARSAGVRQFVFTSAWLPTPYFAIDYFAAKRQTEEYLRASGVPYTILQPTAFMETWAMVVGEPILKTGTAQIFGSGTNPINFVAVDDVAAIAVQALGRTDALNALIQIGGPENLTLLEVAAVFERIRGSAARRRHLPVPVMRLLSRLVRPFNPVLGRQVHAGALMATVPQAVDGPATRTRWDVPMTRMEDWARRTYAAERAWQPMRG
jgi:NADH dehydrogenase